MTTLPSGTVTIVFSDIAGSTNLLARLGGRYVEALDDHRRMVRSAIQQWDGYEVRNQGERFFVVFEAAHDAVMAALEVQRAMAAHLWPDAERVRVRIGVHTGEPTLHGSDYEGLDVHRAARITGSAHGGQVVLSDATQALIIDRLPAEARLVDLGWHRLKDLPDPEHLYQATTEGLESDFPAIKSLGAASSLPAPTTALVGRETDLEELSTLLSRPDARLVTLTGAGGSGKTRLAIALADGLVHSFRDGVYFIPLADTTSGETMWTKLGDVLGLAGEAGGSAAILEFLERRHLLIVLDNLEQLPEAGEVVAEVLTACPHIVVIATSRRPLHSPAEHEFAVQPLSLPAETTLEQADRSGAVRLFVLHAQLVRPDFEISDETVADVVAVVQRLDGLPLAIELAAARIKLLHPAALLARLDRAMELPAHDSDRPDRQQTLHDAIAWSYDLLNPEQQHSFRQLGVFVGGCDLDAIAAVVGPDPPPIQVVADLVDLSLATIADGPSGELRVDLLQTVADFAREVLKESGELSEARNRHAGHYVTFAEAQAELWWGADQLQAHDRTVSEHGNLRAALTWLLRSDDDGGSRPDPDQALRLAGSVWCFWGMTDRIAEGRRWLDMALAQPGWHDPVARARALSAAGTLAWRQREYQLASDLHGQALVLQDQTGDAVGAGFSLNHLGVQALEQQDYETADAYFKRAVARSDDPRIRMLVLLNSAEVARADEDPERAALLLEACTRIAVQVGDEWGAAQATNNLGVVMVEAGHLDQAASGLRDALARARRLADRGLLGTCVGGLATFASAVDQPARSARLSGAADALLESIGEKLSPVDVNVFAKGRSVARAALGDSQFAALVAEGRTWSVDQAATEGLQVLIEFAADARHGASTSDAR